VQVLGAGGGGSTRAVPAGVVRVGRVGVHPGRRGLRADVPVAGSGSARFGVNAGTQQPGLSMRRFACALLLSTSGVTGW
jgi:hypothetical protein